MQRFVKYCKKEHNIQLGCDTIQIGTLHYYRDMNPGESSIADANEGKERVLVADYDSEKATPGTATLLGSAISCDSTSRVVVNNSIIENHSPNCLIFCVSQDPGSNYLDEAQKFGSGYDSHYIITDINAFVLKLGNIIMENFKPSWFHESFQPQLNHFSISDYKQLRLHWWNKEVTYVGKKTFIIQDSQPTQEPVSQNPFERIVFTKEEKYRSDKEYRVVFAFIHSLYGIIPVQNDSIIIPVSPLSTELLPKTW